MRDINFIRLQNFIAQYAPTKQNKNYNIKKLQELETEFEQLKAHCKAADDVNAKMKCCGNCKNVRYEWGEKVIEGVCKECRKYDKWEFAE